jgi:hypothetical protein
MITYDPTLGVKPFYIHFYTTWLKLKDLQYQAFTKIERLIDLVRLVIVRLVIMESE